MEVKLKIIEISPKMQLIKNNPKDIISITFISNNISVKIENIEQSIIKNENITINLKEQDTKKQIIKCLLLRNINNIVASGEFNLKEGINWYNLTEIKNNKMSKESLITSSTSNENINKIPYLVSNSPNSLDTNISIGDNKYFSPRNSNLIKSENIKIKLMVIDIKRKSLNKFKNLNSNKEPSDTSFKLKELSFERGTDYFECSLNDTDIHKLNPKMKLLTTSKKSTNIRKSILFGNNQKRLAQKKINYNNTNKNTLEPIASGDNIISNNKEVSYSINHNSSKKSSKKKKIKSKKIKRLNENLKMKTSFNFYKRKDNLNNKYPQENILKNKESDKKDKKHHKLSSCEIFEDKILDQKFKNYLKNDEDLKANLSKNNSFNLFERNNTERLKESFETRKIEKELYNKDTNSEAANTELNYQIQNLNIYKNLEQDYGYMSENYEKLKIDFLLLYSEENIKNINKEDLLLEMQLMVEKILNLQHFHQKEYIQIFNSINIYKKYINNYQNLSVLFSKKMNKLNSKILTHSFNKIKRELYSENISDFIKVRKKLIKDSEFSIWNKLMINNDKSLVINSYKNKITNIFLNICSKKENKLNKLSLKFYKEMKEKQIKKENKIIEKNKKTKYKSFGSKKVISINTKINANYKENEHFLNKTSKNFYTNKYNFLNLKGQDGKITQKNSSSRIVNNQNNYKYGNLLNETAINNNSKKIYQKKWQLNHENKINIVKKHIINKKK